MINYLQNSPEITQFFNKYDNFNPFKNFVFLFSIFKNAEKILRNQPFFKIKSGRERRHLKTFNGNILGDLKVREKYNSAKFQC